jgi:glutamate-1-semialdehyde 2,1-aminomutase
VTADRALDGAPGGAPVRTLDRSRLARLMTRELDAFRAANPRSRDLYDRATGSLLDGVPMNWMVKWAGGYPLFVESASGAHFTDVDGHDYVDFCLGDTGAMAGHGPAATLRAVESQMPRGITHMLPTEDAVEVGEELRRRFGMRYWQFTLTATDANRFAIRLARMLTGRAKVLFHDYCYHGSVDEAFATLRGDGTVGARRGNIGPPVDPAVTTRIVEYNDLAGLERALEARDVAVFVMEPALTNVGIVLPQPGYLEGVRELTRRYGTYLLIDETHTLCVGPGGATRAWGLDPDFFVIGKSIGGGIPCGTYGFTERIGTDISERIEWEDCDVGGIGGTLAGYALSMAAMRATLGQVLTDAAFARMIPLAERWATGVDEALRRHDVPWHVTRLGARAEYHFMLEHPRSGAEQAEHDDAELSRFLHLYAMNRGILMTPFHNMALMSPATVEADVDRPTEVFDSAVAELVD